ncbi:TNF receptor-associated factor 2 isoform X2 [Brachionus plicatilis]|uniref:TNF receptor-associated factor 2 isoform X2 n=1 Tax=Brachionus plicatilis TaxID=10195 RepID=A0A3M7SUK3_BRAPC|nr:TNF receptor-associated factor 2 isoform X2 [Brachionus plicatilis]
MDQVGTHSLSTQNGYPPFDSSKIDLKYKCPQCSKIIVNAHQADDCGCQYCLNCLAQILVPGHVCKNCGIKFQSEQKFPDRRLQNEISNLIINCSFTDCSWSGKLREYTHHYKIHFEMENKCSNCLLKFENRQELEMHLDLKTGNCAKQLIECDFKKVCPFKTPLLRQDYQEHLNAYQHEHLKLVYEYIEKELKRLREFEEVGKHFVDNRTRHGVGSGGDDVSEMSDAQNSVSLGSLNSKMDMMFNNLNSLISDLTKTNRLHDKLKQENVVLRQGLTDYKILVQDLHKTLALAQVSLLTLEERLVNLEKTNYDGTLLWKINNVQERMQEAKSGRQISFYSPPFYTSRSGYKMCGRVYLNGDGNGRNSHLSLFFVILRGENDALLRWPFKQKVTFILIDQSTTESRENLIDAFRPDPNSSSFRRPTSDMNIASGLPLFCPLGKLLSSDHEYIKDNTLFIKIIVDCKDLTDL